MTDDRDRGITRHCRHGRRHWRGDDDASAASSSRRQDARGATIVFMIRTATAGTGLSARPATTANNLTATREGIWTALLYGPTCRAPSRGASGATRAIKEDGSVTTAIATKRSRGAGRAPSRSGAAAFSAAAMAIRTTTKANGSSPRVNFLGSCF
jgi:hypothetical protein